jgi:hypothetical protein
MSIHVICNDILYKTWQIYPSNSTDMSWIRNPNLVVTQYAVQCIFVFSCFVLTKLNKLIHDRKQSICTFSYNFKDKSVINDIFKRVDAFHSQRLVMCIQITFFRKKEQEFKLSRKSVQYVSVHNWLKLLR